MKVGDLVWQDREPGGWCIILDIYDAPYFGKPEGAEMGMGWGDMDYPVYKLLHPTEGVIEDPAYYYNTAKRRQEIKEESKNESR